jgi:cold shock CspA family protein
MPTRAGTVTEFDDPRGIGVVTDDEGRQFPFHCTAIADGTRQIDVGAIVRFVDRPGRQGSFEATDIRPA